MSKCLVLFVEGDTEIEFYKQANKVYYKGIRSNGMIEHLDIEKITNAVKDQLNPLYKALGVDKAKQ